jgi:hypothetical protein
MAYPVVIDPGSNPKMRALSGNASCGVAGAATTGNANRRVLDRLRARMGDRQELDKLAEH